MAYNWAKKKKMEIFWEMVSLMIRNSTIIMGNICTHICWGPSLLGLVGACQRVWEGIVAPELCALVEAVWGWGMGSWHC